MTTKQLTTEEKRAFFSDLLEATQSQGVHFCEKKKNAMMCCIQEEDKVIVTEMGLSQVAEQVVIPCLSSKYPWLTRNHCVTLLKLTHKGLVEWVRKQPNADDSLIKGDLVFTNKTLNKFYEELKGGI
jgi:hypothetical protein